MLMNNFPLRNLAYILRTNTKIEKYMCIISNSMKLSMGLSFLWCIKAYLRSHFWFWLSQAEPGQQPLKLLKIKNNKLIFLHLFWTQICLTICQHILSKMIVHSNSGILYCASSEQNQNKYFLHGPCVSEPLQTVYIQNNINSVKCWTQNIDF